MWRSSLPSDEQRPAQCCDIVSIDTATTQRAAEPAEPNSLNVPLLTILLGYVDGTGRALLAAAPRHRAEEVSEHTVHYEGRDSPVQRRAEAGDRGTRTAWIDPSPSAGGRDPKARGSSIEAPAHPHSGNTDRRRGGMIQNNTWGTSAARSNHAMVEPRSAAGAAVVS